MSSACICFDTSVEKAELRQTSRELTPRSCFRTNWPRMAASSSFRKLKLSLQSTETANSPNTAPEAPTETEFKDVVRYDARLPPVQRKQENFIPLPPPSYSTTFAAADCSQPLVFFSDHGTTFIALTLQDLSTSGNFQQACPIQLVGKDRKNCFPRIFVQVGIKRVQRICT